MPFIARQIRHAVWGYFLRDLTGLSLRPRHLELAFEDLTGLEHPFLAIDRSIGLEPPRVIEGDRPRPFALPFPFQE